MSVQQILDYSTEYNKNPWLIEYLKDSDFVKILESNDFQFNDLEEVFFQLLQNMWLDTAIGVQLDVLGIILNVDRDGRTDEAYKTILYAKVQINVSSGEPESIIAAVNAIFNNPSMVEYTPVYPGKFRIWTNGTLPITLEYLLVDYVGDFIIDYDGNNIGTTQEDFTQLNILTGIAPAGVGFLWADSIVDYEGTFIVDYDNNIIIGTYFL